MYGEVIDLRIQEAVDIPRRTVIDSAVRYSNNGGTAKNNEEHTDFKKTDPEYKNDVLEKIISDLNKKLNVAGREIRYNIHEKTRQVMVKVVDTDTGKTIREIPPEKSLDILAKILEQSGLLVDEKT